MTPKKILDSMTKTEILSLGVHSSYTFADDPKHILFTLARYKFVAKLFEGYGSVLEVGCGDGFGSALVAQAVERLECTDSEPYGLEHLAENPWLTSNANFSVHDILQSPPPGKFDAVYSLDVIEHIPAELEDRFFDNVVASTKQHGALIIGTPNITAAPYASQNSQIGHINLKSHDSLKESLGRYYHHVFMFGMNDEVLHTGYPAMAHYLMALAAEPR